VNPKKGPADLSCRVFFIIGKIYRRVVPLEGVSRELLKGQSPEGNDRAEYESLYLRISPG